MSKERRGKHIKITTALDKHPNMKTLAFHKLVQSVDDFTQNFFKENSFLDLWNKANNSGNFSDVNFIVSLAYGTISTEVAENIKPISRRFYDLLCNANNTAQIKYNTDSYAVLYKVALNTGDFSKVNKITNFAYNVVGNEEEYFSDYNKWLKNKNKHNLDFHNWRVLHNKNYKKEYAGYVVFLKTKPNLD